MASYATLGDLAMYGGAESALSGTSLNDQQKALDSASTLADGHLRSRFTLPLATPFPVDLIEAVCKIAYYTLMSVRGYNPETGSDTNIRDRYRDAIDWLKSVARGDVTPDIIDATPGQLGGAFVSQSQLQDDTLDSAGFPVVTAGTPRARGW